MRRSVKPQSWSTNGIIRDIDTPQVRKWVFQLERPEAVFHFNTINFLFLIFQEHLISNG